MEQHLTRCSSTNTLFFCLVYLSMIVIHSIDVDAKELASLCEGWTVGERYLVLITEREGPQNLHAQGLQAIDVFAQFFNEVQEECSAMQMEFYR